MKRNWLRNDRPNTHTSSVRACKKPESDRGNALREHHSSLMQRWDRQSCAPSAVLSQQRRRWYRRPSPTYPFQRMRSTVLSRWHVPLPTLAEVRGLQLPISPRRSSRGQEEVSREPHSHVVGNQSQLPPSCIGEAEVWTADTEPGPLSVCVQLERYAQHPCLICVATAIHTGVRV